MLGASITNLYQVAGVALCWLLVLSAQNPALVAPPAGVEPGRWARATANEVLRLRPPIWAIVRHAISDVALGPYRVRAGATVLVSTKLLHSDPRFWRLDPAQFLPSRWLAAEPAHDRNAYLPYGAGPRFCLGAQLAQAVLEEAARALVGSEIRLQPPDPHLLLDTVIGPQSFRAAVGA